MGISYLLNGAAVWRRSLSAPPLARPRSRRQDRRLVGAVPADRGGEDCHLARPRVVVAGAADTVAVKLVGEIRVDVGVRLRSELERGRRDRRQP
jgi:hypothetical protein